MAADHQHMGAAEQVTAHVNAAFVLLRHCVIEEQGQIQGRANGRKSRLIHRPAVAGRLFRVFTVTAKPSGGNISKWPFHCQNLRSLKKDTSAQSPRPFPVMGKGAALEDICPRRAAGSSTAGADRQGQAAASGGALHP